MGHDYKKLIIWQLGMKISSKSYSLVRNFPSDEKFGISSQISRCSVSIPSNIAEGSSRTDKSFSHFIDIALGSSFELETQLLISLEREYLSKEEYQEMEQMIAEFQKMAKSFKFKLK